MLSDNIDTDEFLAIAMPLLEKANEKREEQKQNAKNRLTFDMAIKTFNELEGKYDK